MSRFIVGRASLVLLLSVQPFVLGATCFGTPQKGPEETVRNFIHAMQGVHGDPKRGAEAVALLWEPARKNLAERAARATAAIGSEVAAGEMLAPSWFSLQVTPRHFATRLDGDWAEVTVRGNTRDEVYVVISGSGQFVSGDTRRPFGPGEVLFAPAGVAHRFEEFTADFATWVFFYGPEGGERPAG